MKVTRILPTCEKANDILVKLVILMINGFLLTCIQITNR